jgi:hypothetical protein
LSFHFRLRVIFQISWLPTLSWTGFDSRPATDRMAHAPSGSPYLTTRSRESYVANAAGIFDDRGLSAAASGACSVSIVGSNTLFKIINDKTKRGCLIAKDGRARSSLFRLRAV